MQVISRHDPAYPALLRETAAAPARLYVRGDPTSLSADIAIAVVGTRKMTSYGRTVTRTFVRRWAEVGATIVSGLAYGVDAEAHDVALDVGGRTVAVLASGVDDARVSPKGNAWIARRMIERGGALISEYPPGTPATKPRFPERNRIVAGLCRATVVIEAPMRSGALLTAYAALDANRDVFAVPGPVTSPNSEGANRLIAKGAVPLIAPDDLLTYYGIDGPEVDAAVVANLDPDAKRVLAAVADAPLPVDALAARLRLAGPAVAAAIAELELAGSVSCDGGVVRAEIDSVTRRRLLCEA